MPIISTANYEPDPTPVPKFTDLLDEYLEIKRSFPRIRAGELFASGIFQHQLQDREKELKDTLNRMVETKHVCSRCMTFGG